MSRHSSRRRVDEWQADAAARGIRIETSLEPAVVTGNRVLLGQLAANLVGNAMVHNVDGGWVRVSVSSSGALAVENSGEVLSADAVATLTEPFVRGGGRARTVGGHDGAGLGLAIVASIVRAHHGTLSVGALPEGGLQARIALPR